MMSKEDESLEEYVDRFQYNLKISPYATLHRVVLKTTSIREMKDDQIETLNLMGKVGISKEEYDVILNMSIMCSQGSTQTKPRVRDYLNRTSRTT